MDIKYRIKQLNKLAGDIEKEKKRLAELHYEYEALTGVGRSQRHVTLSVNGISLHAIEVGGREVGYMSVPIRSPEKTMKAVDAFRGLFYEAIKEKQKTIEELESKIPSV